MESFALIFVIFIVVFVGIILSQKKEFTKLPTFEAYKAQYPLLVKRGRVECHSCGGTKLHMRGVDGANDNWKIHSCTTCGTKLYRSGI